MTIQFCTPKMASGELNLTEEFARLTKEELKLKKAELERDYKLAVKEVEDLTAKVKKLMATAESLNKAGGENKVEAEYMSQTKEEVESGVAVQKPIRVQLIEESERLRSKKEELALCECELDAVKRAFLKKEVDEYRKTAEVSYGRFLDVTDVNRVDDEGTFIFVSKKQLMSFWDKRCMYDGENYCIYGLIDICDIHEDEIRSASIISDGVHFYRGIKNNYSSDAFEYYAVDYSDASLGKFMKPITRFAVNLKQLLDGVVHYKAPEILVERLKVLSALIDSVPTSVSNLPYEVLIDNECRRVIESALEKVVERLYGLVYESPNTLSISTVDGYKKKLYDAYNERLEIARKKLALTSR